MFWDDHGYLHNNSNNKNNRNSKITFVETRDSTEHMRWLYCVTEHPHKVDAIIVSMLEINVFTLRP